MKQYMAGLYWYTVLVIIVAIAIGICVHYSSAYLSEQIRKLIIILSFFLILGITTYPGNLKHDE